MVQVVVGNNKVIAQDVQLNSGNLKLDVEVLGPQGNQAIDLQCGTALQMQLQLAIAGQGGRVDLQRVGEVVLDAARGEGKALWGDAVATGSAHLRA